MVEKRKKPELNGRSNRAAMWTCKFHLSWIINWKIGSGITVNIKTDLRIINQWQSNKKREKITNKVHSIKKKNRKNKEN